MGGSLGTMDTRYQVETKASQGRGSQKKLGLAQPHQSALTQP